MARPQKMAAFAGCCVFERLPDVISAQIFSHIGCPKTVARCRAVCKRWRELASQPGVLVFEGPIAGLEEHVTQSISLTTGLETLEVFPSGKPVGRRGFFEARRPYLLERFVLSWVSSLSSSLRAICLFDFSSSSEVLGRHMCLDLINVFSTCKVLTRLEVSKVQVAGRRQTVEWRDMVTMKLFDKEQALFFKGGGGGGGGNGGSGVRRGHAFPHLTHLKLTELLACTDEYLQSLLDECPKLESLDVHWGNPYETEDEPRSEMLVMNIVVDAPHLTEIRFAFAAYEECHTCCLSLTTPSLRSLRVCADSDQGLTVHLWKGWDSLQSLDLSCHTVNVRFGGQPLSVSSNVISAALPVSSSSLGGGAVNRVTKSGTCHTSLNSLHNHCSGLKEMTLRGWQWFSGKDLLSYNKGLCSVNIVAGSNAPGDYLPEEVRPADISLDEIVRRSPHILSLSIDLPGLRSLREKLDGGNAEWEKLGALCIQVEAANDTTSEQIEKLMKRCPELRKVKVVTASDVGLSFMKKRYNLEDGTYNRFLMEERGLGGRRRRDFVGGSQGEQRMRSILQRCHCREATVQVEII